MKTSTTSPEPSWKPPPFRRLVEHLRDRTDVQNIDLMNLAGFCRNCLSNWLKRPPTSVASLFQGGEPEHVYGMPYDEWKARHQGEAIASQLAAFEKTSRGIKTAST